MSPVLEEGAVGVDEEESIPTQPARVKMSRVHLSMVSASSLAEYAASVG